MKKKIRSQLTTEDQEQQYRIIFESASDGMIISDVGTGLVVDANPAAIAMHGYARDEFIGLHLTAYIHPTASACSPSLPRILRREACSMFQRFICGKTAHCSM